MTWVWIALTVLGLALCVLGVALVALLRRGRDPQPAAVQPLASPVVDEQVIANRIAEAVAAREDRIVGLTAELARRDERLTEQQAERASLDQLGADARALREQGERKLAEAAATQAAAEDFARRERADLRELRTQLEARERRLGEREERLLAESQTLEARSSQLVELRGQAERLRDQLQADQQQAAEELQRVAGLDREQAHAEVMARVEHEARLEATALARDIEQDATRDAESRARGIIVTAIQRLAAEQTSESVVSTLDLPSDEMKGRIIGREGRNIRHFEQVTGVNVMIDDTPGSVLLSCFDPVRREVARLTLDELVADGRIHPARIEEVHERSRDRIEQRMLRAAEDALAEVGISDLDPALLPIIGALRYRTSYGQNVLRHLTECAHIAGMMASELGLDVATCKRAAFLHDIGKALTHEVEGTHAMIGGELARRHGEHPDIVHAIEAHHNEVEPRTVEAVLTQAADAISGSRPGARRESLEAYVQRLDRLEQIASAHDGVDRVFAMQAGREVRVMVSPEVVDDVTSHALAKDIARQIQDELTYPGQIRVTVVRESRASEIAH
ncbi:ribonuclease Y [Luteococcus sp. H138]|uniref:ribonuclease Y n=1 Tax=unclassified Luteococcus TaxID=2639923 RepID=UPI00313C53DF